MISINHISRYIFLYQLILCWIFVLTNIVHFIHTYIKRIGEKSNINLKYTLTTIIIITSVLVEEITRASRSRQLFDQRVFGERRGDGMRRKILIDGNTTDYSSRDVRLCMSRCVNSVIETWRRIRYCSCRRNRYRNFIGSNYRALVHTPTRSAFPHHVDRN